MPGNATPPREVLHPPKSRKFLLFGYYGQGNLGDDLLLRATIDGICSIEKSPSFVVRSGGAISGLDGLDVPIALTDIDAVASDQSKSKFMRLLLTLASYGRILRQCDWFVFGGGTLFHERASVAPLAMIFFICLLARILGVRIAALGVGVAELHSTPGRILLRLIVSMSDIFAVRDKAARAECAKVGAGSLVVVTADLVFTSVQRLRQSNSQSRKLRSPNVGISVYAPALLNSATGERVREGMANALKTVLDRGWNISLLVFHNNLIRSENLDVRAIDLVISSIPDQYAGRITQHVLDAGNIAALSATIAGFDVHCGMRFHGHVLSAIFGRPFVGISIDNKIDAICELFGMPNLPLDRFSGDELVQSIDLAMVRRIDSAVFSACERDAERNFSYLAARLSELR